MPKVGERITETERPTDERVERPSETYVLASPSHEPGVHATDGVPSGAVEDRDPSAGGASVDPPRVPVVMVGWQAVVYGPRRRSAEAEHVEVRDTPPARGEGLHGECEGVRVEVAVSVSDDQYVGGGTSGRIAERRAFRPLPFAESEVHVPRVVGVVVLHDVEE